MALAGAHSRKRAWGRYSMTENLVMRTASKSQLTLVIQQTNTRHFNHVKSKVSFNSCGHTTDFYPGKSNLPEVNSSKISRGKFISGFVLPR